MQKRDFLNLPLYFNSNNGQKRITDFIQKNRPWDVNKIFNDMVTVIYVIHKKDGCDKMGINRLKNESSYQNSIPLMKLKTDSKIKINPNLIKSWI